MNLQSSTERQIPLSLVIYRRAIIHYTKCGARSPFRDVDQGFIVRPYDFMMVNFILKFFIPKAHERAFNKV